MASVSATVEARTKLDGTQFGSAYLVVSVANKVGASRFRDCFWWRRNIGLVRALSWPLQGSTVPLLELGGPCRMHPDKVLFPEAFCNVSLVSGSVPLLQGNLAGGSVTSSLARSDVSDATTLASIDALAIVIPLQPSVSVSGTPMLDGVVVVGVPSQLGEMMYVAADTSSEDFKVYINDVLKFCMKAGSVFEIDEVD